MKKLMIALVVANLLAFAWWRGWLDDWLESGREPQRAAGQVAADKVRVVPIERFDAARAAARSPAPCPDGPPCDPAVPQGNGEAAKGRDASPSDAKSDAKPAKPADPKAGRPTPRPGEN